ncbi:hypothetical protein A6302_01978 [Methylobrevis pamukkalensis]|uniref:D-ribose-binding periplasmic protein n=1 Tax=Methylobrevis pamukkalensis TaxID=1439726 RepID=A0A1E3H2Y6_9HYPH|nr:hypothetical protein A6302_01978 [Methylobrevis pamukkalensis]
MFSRRTALLAAAATLVLAGAVQSANAAEAKKIGLAVANLQANFFNQIKQSVEAYAKEKGIEVITVAPAAMRLPRSARSRISSPRTSTP